MNMFNSVSSVKSKERQYNKLAEIDRFVRSTSISLSTRTR